MVMINRETPETASAGNFHGEYPGKVWIHPFDNRMLKIQLLLYN